MAHPQRSATKPQRPRKTLPGTRTAQLQVHNFPAVDALQQPSSLFQMTIAQKRTVNRQGLEKASQQLRAAPQRLYFCVPGSLFATFASVDSIAADVEQWALEVPGFA